MAEKPSPEKRKDWENFFKEDPEIKAEEKGREEKKKKKRRKRKKRKEDLFLLVSIVVESLPVG